MSGNKPPPDSCGGHSEPPTSRLKRMGLCLETILGIRGDDTDPKTGLPKRMGRPMKMVLGVFYALGAAVLVYVVYCLWPATDANGNVLPGEICLFRYHFWATPQMRFILLVAAIGALGSYVHAATSFADYEGNRRLFRSWSWFYVIRVPAGAALALVFYLVVRAGMFALSTDIAVTESSTYTFAAASGLAGMFSKQAIDKLAEVFDAIFKVKEERSDTLSGDYPKPEITGLDPGSVPQGATADATVRVYGKGFVTESRVRFNGVDRDTTYVSEAQLKVIVKPDDVVSPADVNIKVTVFNPPPNAASSNEYMLRISPQ